MACWSIRKKYTENWRKFFDSTSMEYVTDEIMLAYRPRRSKSGNLPHLSYCHQAIYKIMKSNPAGTKIVLSGHSGRNSTCDLYIQLQEGNDNLPHHDSRRIVSRVLIKYICTEIHRLFWNVEQQKILGPYVQLDTSMYLTSLIIRTISISLYWS